MKARILFSLFFGIFAFASTQACPVVHLANIRVIDEFGKTIPKAKVYSYYSLEDSIQLRLSGYRMFDPENKRGAMDSSTFGLYSSGYGFYTYSSDENQSEKQYLIQAPGYADVSIKSVRFKRDKKKDFRSVPILEVVMYAKKLVRTDNVYKVYESYFLRDEIMVTDSLRLELADYLLDIKTNEKSVAEEEVSQVSAKAYPNPVVEELHIQFSFIPKAPHKIMLHDAQGKLVYETTTENAETEILMNWYSPGTYYLTIYDPINTPLLRQQIVKK